MEVFEMPLELRTLRGPLVARLTDDEFFQLCQDNPTFNLERNAQHDLTFRSPASTSSGRTSGECYGQLWLWNRQQQLGESFDSSTGFTLPNGAIRSPDAAWLNRAQYDRLTADQLAKFSPVCPVFVVEVKSPSDRLRDLQTKMEEYLANGAQLGFLLDVEAETAHIYRPGQPAETVLGYDQELSGEPVLPGFRLDLRPLRRK